MGLIDIHTKNISRPNINIRFDELVEPLKKIQNAIVDSNDKLIESQKEKFVDLNGISVRVSLIEAITEVQDNKFCVIFSRKARTDKMEFEYETSLDARKLYNRIAQILEIDLSLPVCTCGETTENQSIDKYKLDQCGLLEGFICQCDDCRRDIMLKEKLYRIVYDICNNTSKIVFLDGQEIVMNPYDIRIQDFPVGKL